MKNIAILGSTGSIGTQTLDVVREHRHLLKVTALAAGSNVELLEKQIRDSDPNWYAFIEKKKQSSFGTELLTLMFR